MSQASQVAELLRAQRVCCSDEYALQQAVAELLDGASVPYAREYRIGVRDRLDFLVAEHVALELKVKTTSKRLLRQVMRYAEHDFVHAIVAASTTHHVLNLPTEIAGKPVHRVHLGGW